QQEITQQESGSQLTELELIASHHRTDPGIHDYHDYSDIGTDSQFLCPRLTSAPQGCGSQLHAENPDVQNPDVQNPDVQNPAILESLPILEHIGLLQQQIDSLSQSQNPATLALAYRTLGNFYRDCIEQGEGTAEHLTIAIQAYEQALQWLPDRSLEQAETLNDLGSLYWMVAQLQQGEEAIVCLQQTTRLYQQSLEGIDPEAQPHLYASVQNNLGATYADLARYQDTCQNLQQSIAAYRRVLQYRAAPTDPIRYASTQNNLGTTYWNLAQHQQPELNLKQAIHAYSEALRYHDPQHEPLNYAMIQNNLGTAFWNLAQYEQPHLYLQQALTAYHDALQYRSLEAAPAGYAATQNNLGTAYWHLTHHTDGTEKRHSLQQSIIAYESTLKAVEVLRMEGLTPLNFDLASTYHNLGLVYGEFALTQDSEPLDHPDRAIRAGLEKSLYYHQLALQEWKNDTDLRQAAFNAILQTLRAAYTHLGLIGQNHFLSQLPSELLSEVLSRL
ncbi:MAG: tetratricopeptide repeat protein, partial [Elainella sp. Prado103]|nr:tetratricopeptide repeat protein [Elainella sp. Prado103]